MAAAATSSRTPGSLRSAPRCFRGLHSQACPGATRLADDVTAAHERYDELLTSSAPGLGSLWLTSTALEGLCRLGRGSGNRALASTLLAEAHPAANHLVSALAPPQSSGIAGPRRTGARPGSELLTLPRWHRNLFAASPFESPGHDCIHDEHR